MMRLSLLEVFCLGCFVSSVASTSSRSEKRGHTRGHHTEQSVVVLAEVAPTPAPPAQVAGAVTVSLRSELQESVDIGGKWDGGLTEVAAMPLPWMEDKKKRQQARKEGKEAAGDEKKEDSDEDEEADSDDPLKAEAEVMESKTTKAGLQRKLVALIWLERVLQQNLDSMEEDNYKAKIGSGKASLEKDTTPATAEMLSRMRTEMHEFSVPFFQKAVKDELKDVRARQKVLLDKIIAIDAGEDPDEVVGDDGSTPPAPKKKEAAPKKKEKKELTKKQLAARAKEKAASDAQSEMCIFIMASLVGVLVLILVGIAIKMRMHAVSS